MEAKPKRSEKLESSSLSLLRRDSTSTYLHDLDVVGMLENNKFENKKYFDEDQVKSIWDFAMKTSNDLTYKDEVISHIENKQKEKEYHINPEPEEYDYQCVRYEQSEGYEGEEEVEQQEQEDIGKIKRQEEINDYDYECDEYFEGGEFDTKNEGRMEWTHMYPTRKSIYNRKSHFLSFIQNYTKYHLGRKLMSEYEQTMCDFILDNMKPRTSEEFLEMLKGCKLSNVYRYYDHIFTVERNGQSKQKQKQGEKELDIKHEDIDRIYNIFSSFQAFFHRQKKFDRKNFLSMRFVLGRILVYLGIVKCKNGLPVDLCRPKGKVQLEFHEQVWQMFLDSL